MKNFLVVIVILFAFPVVVSAETLEATFSWDGADDPESFVMYERTVDGKTEVATVVGTERVMTWDQDIGTNCHTFFMTAVVNGLHTNPSNPHAFCPDPQLPDMILRPGGTINLNIQVVQ